MRNTAAVTICSINYIAKALVLFESYRYFHPESPFYIVIVDRKTSDLDINRLGLSVIWAEDLPIDNFLQHAFAFDVIELNTNIKPTALKILLADYDSVLYFDPDIKLYSRIDSVFESLESASIVVTPHSTTPILDGTKPDDLDFLRFGTFNLGFIGVSKCAEAYSFLDWWSVRCLEYGFYEPQLGLAVDQKWVNLVPALYPAFKVLYDVGFNVAFWNLHERRLSLDNNVWMVNDKVPLRFIHFSSFNASAPEGIAHKQSRFGSGSRPDFVILAQEYARQLSEVNFDFFSKTKYGFDYFDDGVYVTPALRRFYAAFRNNKFSNVTNPFDSHGRVRAFAKKYGLLARGDKTAVRHLIQDMSAYKIQMKIILKIFRLGLFILGPNRYYVFMKYLAHVSSLRNQTNMFE